MAKVWPPKDPDEVLDYEIDWSARLVSEVINASEWTISGSDNLLLTNTSSYANTATTIWLEGGTLNVTYSLTNRITTSGLRTMDQTVKLKIKAK